MLRFAFALVAVLASALVSSAAADYIKDGKLSSALVIDDLQGGFAGFTGKRWTIQTDGKWMLEDVLPGDKTEATKKGQLTKEQLEVLAKKLAEFDARSLAAEGKADVNPRVVRVKFGDKATELTLPTTGELPGTDAKTMPGRYAGIFRAVQEATKTGK